jgi:anti-sigma B factor antagonist
MFTVAIDGSAFTVDVAETPDGALVRATGDVDLSTVATLVDTARAVLRDPPATLTIDMAGVNFCDSAGINGLVALKSACRTAGWSLKVLNLRDHVHYVIVDLTGLGEFLGVEPDVPTE